MNNVLSTELLEQKFGVSLKPKLSKQTSEQFVKREWSTSVTAKEPLSPPTNILRHAILSGVTSPYLRCMCVMAKTNTHIHTITIEPLENPLTREEMCGVLMQTNKQMTAFKEYKATHRIDASQVSHVLTQWTKKWPDAKLCIINVHHDYMRVFNDMQIDASSVIWDFIQKDVPFKTV
jgi:hypothetical protein